MEREGGSSSSSSDADSRGSKASAARAPRLIDAASSGAARSKLQDTAGEQRAVADKSIVSFVANDNVTVRRKHTTTVSKEPRRATSARDSGSESEGDAAFEDASEVEPRERMFDMIPWNTPLIKHETTDRKTPFIREYVVTPRSERLRDDHHKLREASEPRSADRYTPCIDFDDDVGARQLRHHTSTAERLDYERSVYDSPPRWRSTSDQYDQRVHRVKREAERYTRGDQDAEREERTKHRSERAMKYRASSDESSNSDDDDRRLGRGGRRKSRRLKRDVHPPSADRERVKIERRQVDSDEHGLVGSRDRRDRTSTADVKPTWHTRTPDTAKCHHSDCKANMHDRDDRKGGKSREGSREGTCNRKSSVDRHRRQRRSGSRRDSSDRRSAEQTLSESDGDEHKTETERGSVKSGNRTMRPPIYDGNTPVATFLAQFGYCADVNAWSEKEKVAHLMNSLRGNAADLVTLYSGSRRSFDDLVEKLEKRFGVSGQALTFRAQLRNRRRMSGEKIASLYQDIARLAACAFPGQKPEVVDALAVDYFIDSLDDADLELRLRDRRPKDLDEAYQEAVILESHRSRRTENKEVRLDEPRGERGRRDYRQVRSVNEAKKCAAVSTNAETDKLKSDVDRLTETVQRLSAAQKDCNENANARNTQTVANVSDARVGANYGGASYPHLANRVCYHCGQEGHIARLCPARTTGTMVQSEAPSLHPPGAGSGFTPGGLCFTCGQQGHFSRQCPHKTSVTGYYASDQRPNTRTVTNGDADKNSLVYLRASFQGANWLCLLDSGCETSVVPRRLVKGVKLEQSQKRLTAANGTGIPVDGAATVLIRMGRMAVPTRVLVSAHITEPILGADWLRQHRCVWDWEVGRIRLYGHEMQLVSCDSATNCRRITVSQSVIIPARSEQEVEARVEARSWRFVDGEEWMTGCGQVKEGLLVANGVVKGDACSVPVRVMNVTDKAAVLEEDTLLAEMTPVEVIDEEVTTERKKLEVREDLEKLIDGAAGNMTEGQVTQLKGLIYAYQDVFSRDEYDLGECRVAAHRIDTGNSQPVKQQLRRQPMTVQADIDRQVQQMHQAGVIEPSCSPWASNVVMVKKRDGTQRFCIDYRKLNDLTRKDSYPLPRVDMCLDSLAGARFFSSFDLRSGYHQVLMDPGDAEKTSFITRNGSWQFRRLPFGLCNAGATFQRIMNLAMAGLNFSIMLVYLDDIIVYSRTIDEHLTRLKALFDRLRSANLKLKPSKCHLVQAEVKFLGHMVSADGIGTDPDKTTAVTNWPVPTNVHDVRAFLGLCSYYRRFVEGFARIAAPLHRLTAKHVRFEWSDLCQAAFDELKERLVSAPVLALPDEKEAFVLDTDASYASIGAVLSQRCEGGERVVAYGSRVLSRAEQNYSVTRKELLAVVFFLKTYRQYLLGKHFTVRTDHSALQWLRRTPDPIGQQARWLEIMEEFDFTVEHRAGRSHGNADAMSRRPVLDTEKERQAVEEGHVRQIVLNETQPGSKWTTEEIEKAYSRDMVLGQVISLVVRSGNGEEVQREVDGASKVVKAYWAQRDRLRVVEGKLWRMWYGNGHEVDRWQWIPPSECRKEMIEMVHAGWTGNHVGLRKTLARIQLKAYWYGWQSEVERTLLRCDRCAQYLRGALRKQGALQPMPVGDVLERLSIDITGPHPRSARGHNFILTVVDAFSKFAWAFAIRSHDAVTVATCLVEGVFSLFGIPKQILSDRGAEFEGHLMRELCVLLGIDKIRTTAYKPSTNGLAERFHRTLNSLLGKVVDHNQRDWSDRLPHVLAAYRSSVHESTGFSPNMLMFGREVATPVDLLCGRAADAPVSYVDFVERQAVLMAEAHELARQQLGVTAQREKRYYDMRVRPKAFHVGDWVWYFYPRRRQGLSPKWQRFNTGPFLVVQELGPLNYRLQRSRRSNSFVAHVDKLKPYCGDELVSWLATPDNTPDAVAPEVGLWCAEQSNPDVSHEVSGGSTVTETLPADGREDVNGLRRPGRPTKRVTWRIDGDEEDRELRPRVKLKLPARYRD